MGPRTKTRAAPPSPDRAEGGAASSLRPCLAALAALVLSAGCGATEDPRATGAAAGAGPAPAVVAGAQGTAASSAGAPAGVAGAPASSGAQAGAGPVAQAAGSASGGKLSFATDVYERVIRMRCSSCHSDAPSFGGLAFFPGGAPFAYGNLVNVPAGQAENFRCKGSDLMRVRPGDPEHSLLYLKLTMPPCGNKMPPMAFTQATTEQVNLVRQWIADGAAP